MVTRLDDWRVRNLNQGRITGAECLDRTAIHYDGAGALDGDVTAGVAAGAGCNATGRAGTLQGQQARIGEIERDVAGRPVKCVGGDLTAVGQGQRIGKDSDGACSARASVPAGDA